VESSIASKIVPADILKERPSKNVNYQAENSAIKKISSAFGQSLEIGLTCLVESSLKISDAQCGYLQLSGLENEILTGHDPSNVSEAIRIIFSLPEEESGYFWVGKCNSQNKFDHEDYRVLESLGEIASAFIQTYHLVKLERDNLERVFNSTPSASAIWRGDDLIFDKVNDVYKSLFPDLDLEGKPFEEALPPRIVRDYPELFRNVLKTGKPFSIQEQYTPVQHYQGGPLEDHYYNVNFVQLKNRDGSPYGVYQHTVDITEQVEARKKLEAETNKLEAVFDDSPAALAMFRGRSAIFEKINQPWSELVGPREYIGKMYKEVYPEFLDSGLLEKYEAVFDSGEPYRAKEMPLMVDIGNGQKETRYYDFTYVRVLDGEGKPFGVFCHCTNVTENKKFNELLQAALRSRDVFMSLASHELNTPLTSLKLQTQLRKKNLQEGTQQDFTPEKNLQYLNHTLAQIHRLALLVNDMLDVGKINAGHFKMVKSKINLTELLRDSIDRFQIIRGGLIAQLQDNVLVNIDPLRIDQVVTNILTNTIKYAADGAVVVTLKTQDGYAIVSIKDEGMGIAKEHQLRIFERFERVTSEFNISGMGLGLFISKQIVNAHNGVIGVESVVGAGAEFYFKIPLE
jgi:nitrogen-specific signal transduction histidine kinase